VVLTAREVVGLGRDLTMMFVYEDPSLRVQHRATDSMEDRLLFAAFPLSVRRAAGVAAGGHDTAAWVKDRSGIDAPVTSPVANRSSSSLRRRIPRCRPASSA